MWDYEFQNRFAEWLHARSGAARTCCLIGIRTQESFNRWRTIYSDRNHYRFAGKRWIRQWVGSGICNAYPLYDWLTTDVWTANGRFGWSYNRLYDLFYRAGVPLEQPACRQSLHLAGHRKPAISTKPSIRTHGAVWWAG